MSSPCGPSVISDRRNRQILVNLGNRYAVFAPEGILPQPLAFDPERDSVVLPRVADEDEVAEQRIADTARVSGWTTLSHGQEQGCDLEFQDGEGNITRVDVKVGHRDPRPKDFSMFAEALKEDGDTEVSLEMWAFNIEKLGLTVISMDGVGNLRSQKFVPIDVWEKSEQGVFRRDQVVNRVNEWIERINYLYDSVRNWLSDRANLTVEVSRSVVMSEEVMQHFSVPDRELPVLDISDGEKALVSFVPRGLYIIGALGRVDIITQQGTRILVDQGEVGAPDWCLVSLTSRRKSERFGKEVLVSLVGEP